MLAFILRGHVSSCPVPNNPCVCEKKQYAFTGILALIAGSFQAFMGNRYSLALLSDSLHALTDAAADLFGIQVASRVKAHNHRADEIRKRGDRVIALLLVAGALWILYEALSRWIVGGHYVSPPIITIVGFAGGTIDALRWFTLRNAQILSPNSTRAGIIAHAKSDFWHSVIVFAVGGAMWSAGHIAERANGFIIGIDLALSSILALYMMFFLAIPIWKGEHFHDHDGHGHGHHHH